ncbi:hypothetical protein [Nocardia albiluteola]|uniref:hypothetical protein n=1 Tax=Nocardia albiluteola TaxID=2842303 RepID=UPI001FDA3EE6|nr:hypothetical protein [Nocardia albiluteola]
MDWFVKNKMGFNILQSQQPQTLAHALMDSPTGLVGWNSQLLGADLDDEFVLTNIAIHWLTGTAGSAIRHYFEKARAELHHVAPALMSGEITEFFAQYR